MNESDKIDMYYSVKAREDCLNLKAISKQLLNEITFFFNY